MPPTVSAASSMSVVRRPYRCFRTEPSSVAPGDRGAKAFKSSASTRPAPRSSVSTSMPRLQSPRRNCCRSASCGWGSVRSRSGHRPPKTGEKSQRCMEGFQDSGEVIRQVGGKTHVVSVCDREADCFEFFDHQRRRPRVELSGPCPAGPRSWRRGHEVATIRRTAG